MSEKDGMGLETRKPSCTRREFLQDALALAGATAASSLGASAAATPAGTKRPNLIFFLGEGQRADALSLMDHPILKTPHHDRIGVEGARFDNAFCTNALCAPARSTIMTGLYSRTNGALSNKKPQVPLPADMPMFTDLLHKAGYDAPHQGIRTETHKLIAYTQGDKEHELYDLKNDPKETQNLWGRAEHAAVQQDLLARMNALSAKIPARSGPDVG